MKVKNLVLSINVFFFLACNSKEVNHTQGIEEKAEAQDSITQSNQTVPKDTSKTVFIDNDEFVFRMIESELSLKFFRENFNLIKQQIIPNKHNPSLKDTFFVFTNNVDTANFYVSQANTILQEALINSQEIIIDNDIKIGVSSDVFRSKFNLEVVPDSLIIKDFENSSYFLFTFMNGKLSKIVYKARYID